MLMIQNYIRAKSLEEAWQLNQKPSTKIAGGMMWLRLSKNRVNNLIDLSDLHLNQIEEDDEKFTLGAYVTLRDLELHSGLNQYTSGVLRSALEPIVGTQFRNMATLGGSLYGRYGFSDVLTVFLALDCFVELYKGGIIPLSEYVKMDYDKDILVHVIVKKTPLKLAYQSMRNTRTDFPVLTVCISRVNNEFSAVVGARPMRALKVEDTSHLLDSLNPESIQQFSSWLSTVVPTSSNMRGSAEYRSHLIQVLAKRCLLELEGK